MFTPVRSSWAAVTSVLCLAAVSALAPGPVLAQLAAVGQANGPNVTIVDLTSPAAPLVRGTVTTVLVGVVAVAVDPTGTRVVAGEQNGCRVAIINISDPSNPVVTGTFCTAFAGISSVAVSGTRAIVGQQSGPGVLVLDISGAAPVPVGSVINTVLTGISSVAASGSCAIAGEFNGNRVVGISMAGTPAVAGTAQNTMMTGVSSVSMSGTRGIAGQQFGPSIQGITVAAGCGLTLGGSLIVTGMTGVRAVSLSGTRALVGEENGPDVAVVNMTTIATPVLVSPPGAMNTAFAGVSSVAANGALGIIGQQFGPGVRTVTGVSATPALGGSVLTSLAGVSSVALTSFVPPTPPAATFSSSSLAIAPNPVLAGASGSAALTVSNGATSSPLTVSSAALTSSDPAGSWSVSPATATINGGASATFTVTLTVPASLTADRNYSATLTINSNDPVTPAKTIAITGHGHVPQRKACYSATTLTFGSVNTGNSLTKPFTVSSCGELPLDIMSVTLMSATPAVWTVTPATPPVVTLPAMTGSKTYNVTLNVPGGLTADVPYSATIQVTTNDQVNPALQSISASGTGHVPVARIVIDPAYFDIDYDQVELGFHFSRPLVVKNAGDLGLTFQVSYVNPASLDHTQFTLETTPNTYTLAPAGERIFKETFAPTSPGIKSITIRISNTNDATFTMQDVTLHGEGTPPRPIDAVLVLDRSGSMSGALGGGLKIQSMSRASVLFTDLLRDGVDHLGLTKYDHEHDNILNLAEISSVRSNAVTLLTDINGGLKPRGSTGIGGAMRKATEHYALTPDPSHRKVMVVLTDGKENEDPRILEVLNGDASHQPLFTQFPDLFTYSVGLGLATDINADRLQEITNRGAGGTYHVTGDLTGLSIFNLENFYFKIFADAVGQQIVVDPAFSVGLGSTLDVPIPIITEDREALVFFIGELPQQAYAFELLNPAGQVITSSSTLGGMSVQLKQQLNWMFFRIKFPPASVSSVYAGIWHFRVWIGNPGQWTSGAKTHLPAGGSFGTGGVHRMSVAASVGSTYRLEASVGPALVDIGQPIYLRAALTDGGWPSPSGGVTVAVQRPDGGLAMVTLLDDGLHSDDGAGDGVFGGVYGATNPRGVYQFHFKSIGTTERGEEVRREALRNQFVGQPEPDPVPGDCIPCRLKWIILILILVLLLIGLMLQRNKYRYVP